MDASDPLVQFKIHAVQTNEIFLLVADIYAAIIERVDSQVNATPPVPLEQAVADSLRPLAGYVQELWWDAAVAPAGTDPAELRSTLQTLVSDSWGMLNHALRLGERRLDGVLGPEFMARLIGMFEQNNVGVRATSPLGSLSSRMAPGDPAAGWLATAAEEIAQSMEEAAWADCDDEDCQDDEDEGDEEGEGEGGGAEGEADRDMDTADAAAAMWNPDKAGDDEQLQRLYAVLGREGLEGVFPPLDGTAFYSLVCKINHSCEPNVLVRYPAAEPGEAARPLVAQLFALRDLAPGEELVQSYIDQNASFEKRRAALRDYGFECSCRKCQLRE